MIQYNTILSLAFRISNLTPVIKPTELLPNENIIRNVFSPIFCALLELHKRPEGPLALIPFFAIIGQCLPELKKIRGNAPGWP